MRRAVLFLLGLVLLWAGFSMAQESIIGSGITGGTAGNLVVDLNWGAGTSLGTSACSSLTSCLSVTRASSETCTDASGNITYASSNTACATTGGLQVIGSVTNLLIHSAQDSGWTTANTSASINATPPDGNANTGTTLTEDTSANVHSDTSPTFSVSSGTTYNLSCYFKAGTRGFAQISAGATGFSTPPWTNINLSTGAVGGGSGSATTTTLANGWYRINVSASATSNTSSATIIVMGATSLADAHLSSYTGTSLTILFWGCQASTANSVYVPTTTATVTKAGDNISATGNLATALAVSTGTVIVNANSACGNTVCTLIDANGTNLLQKNTPNPGACRTLVGATLATGNTVASGATIDCGLAWDASGGRIQLNAGTVATDATARTPAGTFFLGSTSGSTNLLGSNITHLRVYKVKLSSPQ